MKKILTLLVIALGLATAVNASESYSRDVKILPAAAQTVLKNNFKAKTSVIKIDKTLGHIDNYEVILTDGTEIEFDNNGNWKNVEVNNNRTVPAAFIPQSISSYVKTAQPGTRIVGIEKERNGFTVDLSNGVEMKFDTKGQFKRYDD